MKGILEFTLPEEREDFEASCKGVHNKIKIDELYQEVFRPHFKYDAPLVGEELTSEHRVILEAIWKKINLHFSDEE